MGKINTLNSASFSYIKSTKEKKKRITQSIVLIMNDYISKNYSKETSSKEGISYE